MSTLLYWLSHSRCLVPSLQASCLSGTGPSSLAQGRPFSSVSSQRPAVIAGQGKLTLSCVVQKRNSLLDLEEGEMECFIIHSSQYGLRVITCKLAGSMVFTVYIYQPYGSRELACNLVLGAKGTKLRPHPLMDTSQFCIKVPTT